MKKLLLITTVLFLSTQIFSQKDFSLAKVGKQIMGVYIFVGSEPANEYDYIATIKVRWHEGNPEESFLELIERGKKKYTNFNAVIFKDYKFETVDLIKFRGLEISGGGYRVGDYGIFNGKCGKIVQLDNPKQRAVFKYQDKYGDDKLKKIPYEKLSMISKEQHDKLIEEQIINLQKHQFIIGEKVSWIKGKFICYGEVISLNTKSHDAILKSLNKYGEYENSKVDFLKVDKLEVTKFQEYRNKELEEIKKHQFEVGQKVSFIKNNKAKCGVVVLLNNNSHKATIRYLDIFAEDKTLNIGFLNVEKISGEKYNEGINKIKIDALQYKFEVGEKLVWQKTSRLGAKKELIKVEVISLSDLEHKATVKFNTEDNLEKKKSVSYLDLSKIK